MQRVLAVFAVVVILLTTAQCTGLCTTARSFNFRHHHGATELPQGRPSYSYETKYFKQQVDHFGFDNDDVYNQRYLIANQYWNTTGGPIFFYTGNEGDIELFCENTGFMWDIAPQFKAMVVFAEHRYYGKSMPYGSAAYANSTTLNYLTSEQALVDFGELIRSLKQTIPGAAKSKVIVFGGSYGGMLSAWMRIKYPSLVQGALAASAPIWQFTGLTPCNAFYDTTTATWNDTSQTCVANIHLSYQTFDDIAAKAGGFDFISSTFKLCKPLKSQSDLDVFKALLADSYVNFAMMNYPYPTNFFADLPGWPIKVACQFLSKPLQGKALLVALSNVTNLYFNYSGNTPCLNSTGDSTNSSGIGLQGWSYQACTEMVQPMCSKNSGMFYYMPWDLQAYSDNCFNTLKVRPRKNWISLEYWAKNLSGASNIIFSNGLYDPWSSGGVMQSISETVVAIQIEQGAHHYDIRGKNDNDTPAVKAARDQEINIIKHWLGITPQP